MMRVLTATGNFILVLAAVSCTLGAVISGFGFAVDPLFLFLSFMAASLFVAILTLLIRFKGALILLTPILLVLIWRYNDFIEGAKWVIFYISKNYSTWLFVPVLFSTAQATAVQLTLFFSLSGALLTIPLSYAICIRKSTFLTVLLTVPFVMLLFVHVYVPPHPVFLIGLLAVVYALLFDSLLRKHIDTRKKPAILIALAFAIVFLAAAYIIAPEHDFARNRSVQFLDLHVREFAKRTGIMKIKPGVGWPFESDGSLRFDTSSIQVSDAGSRVIHDIGLLEVTSSEAGSFYIRGYTMQRFDRGSWSLSPDDETAPGAVMASGIPALIAETSALYDPDFSTRIVTMTINRTGDITEDVVYLPYYITPIGKPEYPYQADFFYTEKSIPELYELIPPDLTPNIDLSYYQEHIYSRDTYLQINNSTAEGLRRIAGDAGIDLTAERAVIAGQVAGYFSSFGRYTLTPLVIPEDEDFALYFLRSSQHGYCIHYATAATLMLRALDIPARFAVGLVVSVQESEVGQPIELTDRSAHAWVEVFFEDYGWLPLEVTPPVGGYDAFTGGLPVEAVPDPALVPVEDWFGVDQDDPFDYLPDDAVAVTDGDVTAGESLWHRYNAPLIGLLFAVVVFALVLRRLIISYIRKKRFSGEDINAAVICAWAYLSKLAAVQNRSQLSKAIRELALKACFSQHRLNEKERAIVVSYTWVFADDIYEQFGTLRRFIVKYIVGL